MLMFQQSCDGAPNMPPNAGMNRRNLACTLGISLLLASCVGTVASHAAPDVQLGTIERSAGGSSVKDQTSASKNRLYYRSEITTALRLPFSDAVRVGNLVYINNQIGNRPGEGFLAQGGFTAQFAQIIRNMDSLLEAMGLSRADIVMCTVTLTDMADWAELNRLWYANFSESRLPARNVIGATALPLGAAVGVQCTAAYSSDKG